MKHTIRLRESELRQMISESVKKVLKEMDKGKTTRLLSGGGEYDPLKPKGERRTTYSTAHDKNGNPIDFRNLNEQEGNGLWAEIRFVQGGDDDYEEISQMFCGDDPVYCEGNSQPVIDYLKQWDMGECEITPNKPRIAKFDTSYADENGEYTLLYNSSIGGVFLLYRPANEQEIAWYQENGNDSF